MNLKTAPKFQDMFMTVECYRKPNGSIVLVDYVIRSPFSLALEINTSPEEVRVGLVKNNDLSNFNHFHFCCFLFCWGKKL